MGSGNHLFSNLSEAITAYFYFQMLANGVLKRVHFIASALKQINKKAIELNLQNFITTKNVSITKPLPFKDSFFNLALDITSTMSLDPTEMQLFEKELRRILKNGGVFVSYILANANDDEYMLNYGDVEAGIYLSPYTNIVEHCRNEKEIKKIYSKWKFIKFEKIEKEDSYYGKRYLRRLWWFILQNSKF